MSPSGEWVSCAARIQEEMEARGFDAARLSVATGHPASAIRSWLRCDEVPPADAFARICAALGMSADRALGLRGGSGSEPGRRGFRGI